MLDHEPDVALLGLDGVLATRAIRAAPPGRSGSSCSPARRTSATALLALRAGACGFLSKEVDLEALPRALAGVVDGEAAVSRPLERCLIEDLRRRPEGLYGLRPVKGPLTTREWEVIDLLAPGRTTDDIADSARDLDTRPCARTSRASCASSRCARAATRGQRRSGCGSRPRRSPRRPGRAAA